MYEEIDEKEKVIVPVHLDRRDLIGPDAAHMNIAGISGLATKTSYVTFLIKNLQDYYKNNEDKDNVAYIVFNVKGQDLLHLDKPSTDKKFQQQKDVYKTLGLSTTPIEDVPYFYPFSHKKAKNNCETYGDKDAISDQFKEKASTFSFTYEDSRDLLELFFSSVDDPQFTMESILNKIERVRMGVN